MERLLLILYLPLFLFSDICAQDASHAKQEILYKVCCINDTIENKVLVDTFCLRFNESMSLFYEKDTFENDSLRNNDISKWSLKMSQVLNGVSSNDKAGQSYYVLADYNHGIYTFQDDISGSLYRYTDSLPSFGWQIFPTYKMIKGYKCQKAIGSYMGRKYEVWFTSDISVKANPWKFYGLPGLIIDAYDTHCLYRFSFVGVRSCSGSIALFPAKHFKTTKEKFLREKNLYLDDPVEYLENKAVVKIHFGESSQGISTEMKNTCRHQPIEIIE